VHINPDNVERTTSLDVHLLLLSPWSSEEDTVDQKGFRVAKESSLARCWRWVSVSICH